MSQRKKYLEEKKIYIKNNIKKILGVIFILALGILIGFFIPKSIKSADFIVTRANDSHYQFINPLLSCNILENQEFAGYNPLKKTINNLIQNSDSTKVTTASVYYRDLGFARWFSINKDETYNPASLLKVPLMIAYLKKAENEPDIFSTKLLYDTDPSISNSLEYYKSPSELKYGNYYTVDELIKSMIYHSDNVATAVLYSALDKDSFTQVAKDIGIHLPADINTTNVADYLKIQSYSYLFRLLYNSTYLSRDMSEKALQLLSFSDFSAGIKGGLPKDIKAAEKFGERTIIGNADQVVERELHDCGIVYYPLHPYLLCVMTKGTDFDSMSALIRNISSAVYGSVDEQYKK